MTKTEKVLQLYKEFPNLTCRDLAVKVGCSTRFVRKIVNPIRKKEVFARQKPKVLTPAKILLLDIETSPLEVYTWRLWQQNVAPWQVKRDWSILSWAAKWLFDDKVLGDVVGPADAHDRDDSKLMKDIWSLLEEADLVVTHNGNKFDIPRINTRLLMNGFNPPVAPRSIDTNSVLRKTFRFTSNKMEEVNRSLGVLQKLEHEGFGLWKKSIDGDRDASMSALTTMLAYNKQDVLALEDLYLVLRPWIKSHPNVNLYQEYTGERSDIRCTNCGDTDISWGKKYYTPAGRYSAFRCNSCGAVGRSRYSDLSTDERNSLGISVAY